jgi:hypothetical protein
LRPSAHLHELCDQLGLAVADNGKKLPVLWRQQPCYGIDCLAASAEGS